MAVNFVEYNGKKYKVKIKKNNLSLKLANKKIASISDIKGIDGIADLQILDINHNQIKEMEGLENLSKLHTLNLNDNLISEIKGLDSLVELRRLNLSNNKIERISGLETLKNLQRLDLRYNQISEITGLENQKKLETLFLGGNPINATTLKEFGGLSHYITSQGAVEYCKLQIESSQLEKEENNRLQQRNQEIVEKIHKIMKVSSRVRLDMMRNILELDAKTFDSKVLDWAVEFNFRIDGDFIIIENADIDGFILGLDRQFDRWKKTEKSGIGKI